MFAVQIFLVRNRFKVSKLLVFVIIGNIYLLVGGNLLASITDEGPCGYSQVVHYQQTSIFMSRASSVTRLENDTNLSRYQQEGSTGHYFKK